jgi:6-phosphogluconolactonase/glucosamine-6-phosphate isomerase/deaminase
MTLTAAEIARARHVCLMLTGRDKLATLENAMDDPNSDAHCAAGGKAAGKAGYLPG